MAKKVFVAIATIAGLAFPPALATSAIEKDTCKEEPLVPMVSTTDSDLSNMLQSNVLVYDHRQPMALDDQRVAQDVQKVSTAADGGEELNNVADAKDMVEDENDMEEKVEDEKDMEEVNALGSEELSNGVPDGVNLTLAQESGYSCGASEPLNTVTMKFDNEGDTNLNVNSEYKKIFPGRSAPGPGDKVLSLYGWTHTRNYAKGYVRDAAGCCGHARVCGLVTGALYSWKIYQKTTTNHFSGNNWARAQGSGPYQQKITHTSTSSDVTYEGQTKADSWSCITFAFWRNAKHVHLSGLALGCAR